MTISVAVDAVVLSYIKDEAPELKVLLVTRQNDPFKGEYVLPGGFLDEGEELADGAARELREETGLDAYPIGQLTERAAVDRDPRGRVITFPFVFIVPGCPEVTAADDARTAEWMEVADTDLTEFGITVEGESKGLKLAFDHASILTEAVLPFTNPLDVEFGDDQGN